MPFLEDLSVFFNDAEFAYVCMWTPAGDTHPGPTTITLNAIFDRSGLNVGGPDNVFIETSGPEALCALSDIPNVKQGDTFEANSTEYTVENVLPDGTGLVRLVLGT